MGRQHSAKQTRRILIRSSKKETDLRSVPADPVADPNGPSRGCMPLNPNDLQGRLAGVLQMMACSAQ
jgi:hypothetical protein